MLLTGGSLSALEPEEVLVVANLNASHSKWLAKDYMKARQIPKKNLVLLFTADSETCTRSEYETEAVRPIRRFLSKNPQIRAIVTLYGVPLKIATPGMTPEEEKKIQQLESLKKDVKAILTREKDLDATLKDEKSKELSRLEKAISSFKRNTDKTASFDSELALVKKEDYNLNLWQPNPYFLGFKGKKLAANQSEVLMTCRLDGADETVVRRIISDSIDAEKNGLKGSACFDARWKDPGPEKVTGYAFYDQSIHRTAQRFKENSRLTVILNDTSDLFQKGDCPDTAFYCGWYSLARYVDAFTWAKGSIGFHIASSECSTLKNKNSQVWCKKMLDTGIAATIGPVGEPYVQAFPVPEIFFSLLLEGNLTLAEAYLASLPFLSWKMVLIGDPLYRVNLVP